MNRRLCWNLAYIAYTEAVDELASQDDRTSAAVASKYFAQNSPVYYE